MNIFLVIALVATMFSTPPSGSGVEIVYPKLFANSTCRVVKEPYVIRHRCVTINSNALDSENIRINLFRDANYIGVIHSVTESELGTVWIGHLQGIKYSYFTIMKVGDIFIGNFASPEGVYEVSIVKDNIYNIVQIDQSGFND